MKKLFTLFIFLFYFYAQGQQQKPVIRGGYGKTELSLGAGTILPSSAMKTNTNMGNLTNINLGVYVPILNYGGATGGVISLGFNADGEYFRGNSTYDISNYKPFNITGQTGVPPITAKGSGTPVQQGFKTEGGAQANFSFGSYTISPILNLAYVSLKQEAFSVVQNTGVNGQNYEHTLYNQAESKNSGIAVVAKLTHRYRFGRDWRFSIFAETNYMFGPSATTASTYFTPEGAANAQGSYNLNQMNFGTQTGQTKSTKFNGFGVNAGIGIILGRSVARAVCSCCAKMVNPETHNKTLCCELAKPKPKPASAKVYDGDKSQGDATSVKNETSTNDDVATKATRRRVEVLKSNKTGDPNSTTSQTSDDKLTKADAGKSSTIKDQDGTTNSEPQNIIYGGNPPPIFLCYKLFNLANQVVPIDGFVNMYNVYTISLTVCEGKDPNAFISIPSTSLDVSEQTIVSKLVANGGKSQKGKSIKIERDIDVSSSLASQYNVENAIIKAGVYPFNEKNEVSLPIAYGRRRVEVLKSNKTGDPNAKVAAQNQSNNTSCFPSHSGIANFTGGSPVTNNANLGVFITTTQNSMQGSIPVFLNPTNIDVQYLRYPLKPIDINIHKMLPNGTDFIIANGGYFTPTHPVVNYKTMSIGNLAPGKYFIDAYSNSGNRNMCRPIFIIAKTLVNTTILPSCVYRGQTIPVTWTGGNGNANVNLIVHRRLTVTGYTPINISVPNTGSYNLVIPSTGLTDGETYDIEINDGNQFIRTTYYNQANFFKICSKIITKETLTKAPISTKTNAGTLHEMEQCDCGTWETKQIKYRDATKDISCGGTITIGKNIAATFNLKYNCASVGQNCITKYEVTILKPDGSSTTQQITNNTNWNYLVNMSGEYMLTFKVLCNDKVCTTCTYKVSVK